MRKLLAFFGIGSAMVGALGYTLSQDGGSAAGSSDASVPGVAATLADGDAAS